MKVKQRNIEDVKPNPENPREITAENFAKLKRSITEFPEMLDTRPLVVNPDGIVLGGNMRLRAVTDLGWKKVPVVEVDWDTARQKEFVIKDNIESGHWDWDVLANEWTASDLDDWGLAVWQDPTEEESSEDEESPYTTKITAPSYETTQDTAPPLSSCHNKEKYSELLSEINAADIPEEVAEFMRFAAGRHIVFDYQNIAEYYAHADKEVQKLMERSALVIIDFDAAIKEGYVRLSEDLQAQYLEEHG